MLFDKKTSVILVSVLVFAIMYSVFDSEGGDLTGNQIATAPTRNIIVVGAPDYNGGSGLPTGKIYTYSKKGNIMWSKLGENGNDDFGYSVSVMKDFTGDGVSEVIVGAPRFVGLIGGSNAGRVYVFDGRTGLEIYTLDGTGQQFESFGYSVSSAGDVNNDGYDDIIVGSPGYNGAAGGSSGRVYVYSGLTRQLLFTLNGENPGDSFGSAVSSAGDVNNDGYDDIIVGAWKFGAFFPNFFGRAYVFDGRTGLEIYHWDGNAGDWFGKSVSDAGDVNNDGYDDIIVGAVNVDGPAGTDAGAAYIYSGLDGQNLHSFYGTNMDGWFGNAVAGVGDVNHDSYDDVAISDYAIDASNFEGEINVYSGLDGTIILNKRGENFGERFGTSIASVGNLLIVGAYEHTGAHPKGGKVYALKINGNTKWSIEGDDSYSEFGNSVSGSPA